MTSHGSRRIRQLHSNSHFLDTPYIYNLANNKYLVLLISLSGFEIMKTWGFLWKSIWLILQWLLPATLCLPAPQTIVFRFNKSKLKLATWNILGYIAAAWASYLPTTSSFSLNASLPSKTSRAKATNQTPIALSCISCSRYSKQSQIVLILPKHSPSEIFLQKLANLLWNQFGCWGKNINRSIDLGI